MQFSSPFIPLDIIMLPANVEFESLEPFKPSPNPLCLAAVKELQQYLMNNYDLVHDFGLDGKHTSESRGKMFGVLVVRNAQGQIGYLAAFSGILQGNNNLQRFVPSIGQDDVEDELHNQGMRELTELSRRIRALQNTNPEGKKEIEGLKEQRKQHSQYLQQRLFAQYQFLNKQGEEKSLLQIFEDEELGVPPSAAGDCAAPRLLQYAFANNMQPIGMTEFWWGKPRQEQGKKHGKFYPPCRDKCAPILKYMLNA